VPPPAAPAPVSREDAAVAAAPPDPAAVRQRLLTRLNDGRPASGALAPSQLQTDDVIFVDGPVRAVVRREGLNPELYWLDGDLDLRRAELRPLGGDRYRVREPLHAGDFSLREAVHSGPLDFPATVPAPGSTERRMLEQHYNEGRAIGGRLAPDLLAHGDLVYIGTSAAVVIRRNGVDLTRYWLDGTLDLHQSALQKEGSNKYRVVGAVH
jgi:hypothetical protein